MHKQLWNTALTDTSTSDLEGAGKIRVDEYGKRYRWVKNATGGATAIGDVAFNGSDLTKSEVYLLNQSGKGTAANLMAGVWLAVVASSSYGWIQTFGENPSVLVLGAVGVAVGVSLKGVNDQKYVTLDTAVGTAPTIHRYCVASEAYTTTSAALKKAFINCD